eukprot:3378500-Prymnesium_polylepis.1
MIEKLSSAAGRAQLINDGGACHEPASDAYTCDDQGMPAARDAADVRRDDQFTPTHEVTLANLTHPDSIHLNGENITTNTFVPIAHLPHALMILCFSHERRSHKSPTTVVLLFPPASGACGVFLEYDESLRADRAWSTWSTECRR